MAVTTVNMATIPESFLVNPRVYDVSFVPASFRLNPLVRNVTAVPCTLLHVSSGDREHKHGCWRGGARELCRYRQERAESRCMGGAGSTFQL